VKHRAGSTRPGAEFQIGRIEMVANTGTYIDSPFHRYACGVKTLAQLPLESLAHLEAVTVTSAAGPGHSGVRCVRVAFELRGKAVLVRNRLGPALADRGLLRRPSLLNK
jgi:arylformamidase